MLTSCYNQYINKIRSKPQLYTDRKSNKIFSLVVCLDNMHIHKMAKHKNPEIPHSRIILRYFQYSLICFLFFISLCFSQTEYEDLLKQSDEYMKQKNYKAAINTLKKAHEIGIYMPVDYAKSPVNYCDQEINTTPYEF